jgi:hypothetical protein
VTTKEKAWQVEKVTSADEKDRLYKEVPGIGAALR